MHVSWLLIDLVCYNWFQMIAKTMFYVHVISYINHKLLLSYGC